MLNASRLKDRRILRPDGAEHRRAGVSFAQRSALGIRSLLRNLGSAVPRVSNRIGRYRACEWKRCREARQAWLPSSRSLAQYDPTVQACSEVQTPHLVTCRCHTSSPLAIAIWGSLSGVGACIEPTVLTYIQRSVSLAILQFAIGAGKCHAEHMSYREPMLIHRSSG